MDADVLDSVEDVEAVDSAESFPSLPADELVITTKGEVPHFQPLGKTILTLGREADNDISLGSKAISRHHARLEKRDDQWYVTDLGSTNGTFLAKEQLATNVEYPWQSGHPLQFGPFTLQWQSPRDLTNGQTLVLMPDEYEVAADVIETSVDDMLDVSLVDPLLSVQLGDSAEIKLAILNQATLDKQLTVAIIGIPDHWFELPPYAIKIIPNTPRTIKIKLNIPQSTLVTAGEYAYEVVLRDKENKAYLTRLIGKIVVAPAYDFSLRLVQDTAPNNAALKLQVKNLGNIASTYRFQTEAADKLMMGGKQWTTALASGLSIDAEFRVSAAKRPFFGSAQKHPFTLIVEDEAGTSKRVDSQIEITPHISLWKGLLALIVFTLLLITLALLLR
ncbi:MAG TPA: FHA domain-containing protein [Anaerolineae bacterium]|nr:FHA domain-containing protein [Anaerolineae bacterium]